MKVTLTVEQQTAEEVLTIIRLALLSPYQRVPDQVTITRNSIVRSMDGADVLVAFNVALDGIPLPVAQAINDRDKTPDAESWHEPAGDGL